MLLKIKHLDNQTGYCEVGISRVRWSAPSFGK